MPDITKCAAHARETKAHHENIQIGRMNSGNSKFHLLFRRVARDRALAKKVPDRTSCNVLSRVPGSGCFRMMRLGRSPLV
jgi:hypothetical protein